MVLKQSVLIVVQINWKNSKIRKWLNGDFYNRAFNEKEKKYINSSRLSDVSTTDNVFLLSKEEAEKYFANNNARLCKATEYAVDFGAYVYNGYSCWWLRSPSPKDSSYVYSVESDGFLSNCYVYDTYYKYVVRPALWINL